MNLNPVLDALLAQVVSPKPPAARPVLEPVDPTAFVQVARQLHSDSRLNDQASHYEHWQARFDAKPSSPNASSITTLDQAARTISDLMLAFPRDAKGMSVALSPLSAKAFATPGAISSHLQASMALSGLFFESHIARWYKGEWPLERLRAEMFDRLEVSKPGETAPLKAALLMRHQLELLAGRPLRCEGNLTEGLAMLMLVQPEGSPVDPWEHALAQQHDSTVMQRVRFRLTHQAFDFAQFDLALAGNHLAVRITSPDVVLVEYFRRDAPGLAIKLQDMGFESVSSSRSHADSAAVEKTPSLPDAVQGESGGRAVTPLESLYGSEAELIAQLAIESGIKFTPHMLMLLMHCNHDARLSPQLFSALELLISWSIEQIPHLG